jgi:hypothetical protein
MVAACCRIFDPNSCSSTSEEYKEVTGVCNTGIDTNSYGNHCEKVIRTGYTDASVQQLKKKQSWENTSPFGIPFSVEGNTGFPSYLDQIKDKFIRTYNTRNNKHQIHRWDSGLTNVFTVSKTHEEQVPADVCHCDATVQDLTEDTSKNFKYTSPPGFDVKVLQVHGKCIQEDGNIIELSTGSIRPVALPTHTACRSIKNKWVFLMKSRGGVSIEFGVKNVGVDWHSKPEQTVLNFLQINKNEVYSVLKSRFSKIFYGKLDDWYLTMKPSSRTWRELRHNHTVQLRLRRRRIHVFYQLVGRCGSHFTVFTDIIKHVQVWSPSECIPKDAWVPIATRYRYTPLGTYFGGYGFHIFEANIHVGVNSIDYVLMRSLSLQYSDPSADLKENFIRRLAGGWPTYFNWNTAQLGHNWKEFLYSPDISQVLNTPLFHLFNTKSWELLKYYEEPNATNPDELAKIYNLIGKSIVMPRELDDIYYTVNNFPRYQYRVWQLQGWCGSYHVKTDRVIQVLTSNRSDVKCSEPTRIVLAICNNLIGNETINCTAQAKPVGLTIIGQEFSIVPVLNLTDEAIVIRGYMNYFFNRFIQDESNWDTLNENEDFSGNPVRSRCNTTRVFSAENGTITSILQIRITCDEWGLTACYFETKVLYTLKPNQTLGIFG